MTAIAHPTAAEAAPPYGWLMTAFYLSILAPMTLNVAGFALPPFRILLLLTFFPTLYWWATGRLGRIRLSDISILAFCLWSAVTFFVNHPVAEIYKVAGFTALETAGGYFLGRAIVTNTAQFTRMVRHHAVAMLVMLPFALLESQTGNPIIISFVSQLVQSDILEFQMFCIFLARGLFLAFG